VDKALHQNLIKRRGEARWRQMLNLTSNIGRCGQETEDGCGARQPDRYVRDGIARIVAEWDNIEGAGAPEKSDKVRKERQVLEVEYVLRLFRRITDEDVDFMGLSRYWCRPDWMICTVMAIPPPQVRPSVIQDNNQRSEDDLTHKLFEIVNTNNTLQDKINNNAAKNIVDEYTNVLQYHIATLVDNQIPGVAPSAQRSGRPLKSIQQRLGSKEGRIRYNIQGKRVEFSARSVITPDPNISVAEIGVPMKIAMNLTVPERVTTYNRDQMYKLIQNGAEKYPGAKTLVRADGRMISLKHVNSKEIVLYYGDVVNRHLADGDTILFNRQPTLHRMSMMGHKVKVLPYNTFRLNVSVTSPYNADFDGDEMNAHIPQSLEASTELSEIAAVPHQIVTPRHAKPVIGVVQDSLVGSWRMTRPKVSFNRREFMNMQMWNKRFEGIMPEAGANKRFSGQQILSQLLPPINLEMGNSFMKDAKTSDEKRDNYVVIKEGKITQGIMDKDIFSKPSKGIVHTIFKDYGPTQTVNFIDAMQNTVEQFLVYNGFSVGISDLVADEDTRKEMDKVIKARKAEIENILLQLHLDLFDNNTGKTNQQEFEDKVYTELNKATEFAGKIGLSSLADENRLIAMVRAGSKGSTINIAQMMACVGQQAPEGRRIPYGFSDRTLPHYKKYDDGAEARGFVESSFIQGLTPQEFFFHAMSGREGLIDTAVKTADTGYIQRQLVKAMEDLVIQFDGSVRDARSNVLQFHYGEDGANSTKIENQNIGLSKLTDGDILSQYSAQTADVTGVFVEGTVISPEETAALDEFSRQVLQDRKMIVEEVHRSKDDTGTFASVNLERLILNTSVKFQLKKDEPTDLLPGYVIDGIKKLIHRTQAYNPLWAAMLRFYLAPHKIIIKQRFTKVAFDTLLELIVLRNWQAWAQPGEQVGIIAAQSIGEPSTQMTLNSTDWDTRIMIAKNGKIITPQIGEFIDNYYENTESDKVQRLPNDQIYIELNDGNDWKAISCDEMGKMMWTKLEAITRHPVVNEDGSDTILEVTLQSGRTVKATKAKSFLTCKDGRIYDTNGSDLKIGDKIPIANTLVIDQIGLVKSVSLREILPATEWMYGTDVDKALKTLEGGDRHWFQKNQGTLFTVPYSRSDAFREAFVDGKNTNTIKHGFVYPKRTRTDVSQIPEDIALTKEFGFFAGAYLAEGMANTTQVCITNNEAAYLEKVKVLMDEWNVGTHLIKEERNCEKTGIKGTTSSLIIHSTLLAKTMQHFFGRISSEKTLPDWTFQAPDEFVAGLLDGYISGDGTVSKKSGLISATSVSKELLQRLSTLLTRYGIFATMTTRMPDVGVFQSVRRNYTLHIPAKYSRVFSKMFILSSSHKQNTLDIHFKTGHHGLRASSTESFEDIICDTVKDIKEVRPIKTWVYDLTVEKTRNFMTDTCIALKDTFHLAGVAAKSNVTRGVPRLKELLKVTKSPKAISLTVYLKPEFRDDKEKAREVCQDLELTLLKDVTTRAAIYYDPRDDTTITDEGDKDLITFYKAFEKSTAVEEEGNEATEEEQWSRWMLRIELDRERLFAKNISMEDIAFVLRQRFDDEIHLIYSDFNSPRLIMRIRLPAIAKSGLDDLANLKKFVNRILNGIVIRGVTGIKSVKFREDKDLLEYKDGKYEKVTQYVLDTDGTNYQAVMSHPMVDGRRLVSSHVHDIFENLGIEATRAVLLNEIIMLFEAAGADVNFRHPGLLCDVMTRAGKLMSADRYGINKNDIGPLAKASFEETEKILLRAAVFGEVDPITGVSANIMTGQVIRGGTAFSQLLLDESALMRLQENLPPVPTLEEEEEGPTDEQVEDELYEDAGDMCSKTRLRMNITMPTEAVLVNEPDVDMVVLED
jgi:DNA-directed RNA polymerase beta' subunit